MAYTIYTGAFEQTKDTFLRLTGNPYQIITSVTQDGVDIQPIARTTVTPSQSDCINYGDGVLCGSYNLGKITNSTSTVSVTSTPYAYYVTYHNYTGPSSSDVTTQTIYYNTIFQFQTISNVSGYKFYGWAVGSQNSNIIIPSSVTQGILNESDCVGNSPATLKIPTLYSTSTTTLHLYAKWRPCGAVTINVNITDNSPMVVDITLQN